MESALAGDPCLSEPAFAEEVDDDFDDPSLESAEEAELAGSFFPVLVEAELASDLSFEDEVLECVELEDQKEKGASSVEVKEESDEGAVTEVDCAD